MYTRPDDPRRPRVCRAETSRQVLAEVRPPLPRVPGRSARHDAAYARAGVVHRFVVGEPLQGWRAVLVSAQRTRLDRAHRVKALVDVHDPEAERIARVMDQGNSHSPASRYEAFPPLAAKRLADTLEIQYTPKPGSWLNLAESELSIRQRQGRDRRPGDQATLTREVAAWVAERNATAQARDWRFTTADARIKRKGRYPAVQE